MKRISMIAILLGGLAFVSCKKEQKAATVVPAEVVTEQQESKAETSLSEVATGVSDFLKTEFLTEADLKVVAEADRQFRMYLVDLNNDGKKEIFVSLAGSYFCGSGGCTMLLLDSTYKLITKFTVMEGAVFVEPTMENEWKILNVKSGGEWKKMVYTNGTYPTNPSILEKAPYDAPSGHAEVVFEQGNTLDIYTF
ncbi:hypothetical protein GJV76_03375 [Myroides sp. BIT-d1]|uniref:Lipoprotein n=1 Tax=Myroides albus TaxID=2562892 RepID=A0A6I3LLY7_9FLAO|nr:hypothetical protein [Myroides albus]MTG97182.1 hypothetical protein [Myroides albus]